MTAWPALNVFPLSVFLNWYKTMQQKHIQASTYLIVVKSNSFESSKTRPNFLSAGFIICLFARVSHNQVSVQNREKGIKSQNRELRRVTNALNTRKWRIESWLRKMCNLVLACRTQVRMRIGIVPGMLVHIIIVVITFLKIRHSFNLSTSFKSSHCTDEMIVIHF